MTLPRIPSPWILLGGLIAALIYGEIRAYQSAANVHVRWNAEKSEANATAAREKARIDAENAAKAQAAAIATRNRDAEHAKEVAAIESSRNAAVREFDRRLRLAQARYSHCQLPGTAPHSSVPEGSAPGSETGLPPTAAGDLAAIGADANKLAAIVRQCVDWAGQVGR